MFDDFHPFISLLVEHFGSTAGESNITPNVDEEGCKKEFELNGLSGLHSKLTEELEKWKTVPIHIAVTGQSGCGKSSYINAIRNLHAEDEGAAKVGSTETTKVLTPYKHPDNRGFIVWDLPGVGTENFLRENYLEAVNYSLYDCFIILFSKRFTEVDLWLAEEVKKQNKKCYFARTHVADDVRNEKRTHPSTFKEEDVLSNVRDDCEKKLQAKDLSSSKVFLIDNFETGRFDFEELEETILDSIDSLKSETDAAKKEAIALTLKAATTKFLVEKRKALLKMIPGVCIAIIDAKNECDQKEIFKETLEYYQKQFNVDQGSLSENRALMKLTKKDIEEFQIVYDSLKSNPGRYVQTPTAKRATVGFLDSLKDMFWGWMSKEHALIYLYSKAALINNLERFYKLGKQLYDDKLAKKMVQK